MENRYPHHPCPICKEHLDHRSNQIVKPLLCNHHFHQQCILDLCQENKNAEDGQRCPVCNRVLYKFIVLAKTETGEKNFKFINVNGKNVPSRYELEDDICKYCFIGNLFENQKHCSKCASMWHKCCGPKTIPTTETGEYLCNECDALRNNEKQPEQAAGSSNSPNKQVDPTNVAKRSKTGAKGCKNHSKSPKVLPQQEEEPVAKKTRKH